MEKVDITIIGAGVVGLAVAARLSSSGKSCIILEKNSKFGQETSSRNSEVIHSGIYYPRNSLKAKLCVKGNKSLYEFCNKNNIKFSKLGKVIVATNQDEITAIEKLKQNGQNNGVENLQLLTKKQLKDMEPEVNALEALYSPDTGIIDTHSLMQKYLAIAQENEALISYDSEVTAIEKANGSFNITVKKDNYKFQTELLINCAGLNSDKIASMCGIDVEESKYRLYYCKGSYFRTNQAFNVKRLVYPVPSVNVQHLGIHLTIDLAGSVRFGPNAQYIDTIDYSIDTAQKEAFQKSIKTYLPSIQEDALYPDTAGIRPKLQGPEDGFRDFIICNEKEKKLEGLINLIGIESPGLTASDAIAEYVEGLI
ncbi:MAG: NAD(P)/FAD-dependent oxidoreductase [Endomicrobiales bacterium]|nr:NAD(P)/FAD-dependent oxidoreductase [Endomicrobiales bacterium]